MKKLSILFLLIGLALAVTPVASQDSAFKVIVHNDNPSTAIPASQVAKLFLKQATSWSHGGKVAPVDQSESASARVSFSDQVLKRSVAAVESYWQQQIYSGRAVPPVKVGSDAEAVAFVKSNSGAIGYVSGGADTSGVKVVATNG
jgi:ABC-type phosphate transport system substrate-binding protein